MKKSIVYSVLLSSMLLIAPTASAEGILGFLKDAGKALLSLAVGAAESYVGSSVPDEYKSSYNDMVSSFNNSVGVDNSYASAGSNWQQGKKNDAILDMAEGVAVSTGTSGSFVVSSILDIGRAQNNYNNNIASGMSVDEANAIRNQELEKYAERIYDDYIMSDKTREEIYRYNEMQYTKELREQDRALRNEIWHELLKRGYSTREAGVYMTIIDENPGMLSGFYAESDNSIYMTGILLTEDTTVQGIIARRAKEALDNLNIVDRTNGTQDGSYQANEDDFFGTNINLTDPSPTPTPEPPSVEQPAPTIPEIPQEPIDPSADAKARLKEIAPDRYLLNHVGLNKKQKETLDEVASLMKQYTNIRICLNGNTCDLGSDYINNLIATKRANNAKDYLVKQGIDDSRIEVESKSSSEPIIDGHTGENRLQNRRVSITILND